MIISIVIQLFHQIVLDHLTSLGSNQDFRAVGGCVYGCDAPVRNSCLCFEELGRRSLGGSSVLLDEQLALLGTND